jgi:hypothetical protein
MSRPPTRRYKVTFLPAGKTLEVDPAGFPCGARGEPGSLLDIALRHGIEIGHAKRTAGLERPAFNGLGQ